MPLSSKDIEQIRKTDFKPFWVIDRLIPVLRVFMKIPWFKRYAEGSDGGQFGLIYRYQHAGEHGKAVEIALAGMEKIENHPGKSMPDMDHHGWWSFMKSGVESAGQMDDATLKSQLIDRALSGMEPFEGYDIAWVFLEFSRWMYEAKDIEKGIEYASMASEADATWAEPDFLLGWYALVDGREGAEEHLSRAIEKDRRILFRVAGDDVCKRYPEIIRKLTSKYEMAG